MIPLENYFVLLGDRHVILVKSNCSRPAYNREKETIKQRHIKESFTIFRESAFIWNIKDKEVDAEIFEDLILDLLKREAGVTWAKKVAPTNQPDNGRDIICEWYNPSGSEMIDREAKLITAKKIIVQCKAKMTNSKKQSVGKSDVDISDTIDFYEPDGYLLVASSQITKDITEHLEKLKARGKLWIDWWNRVDIEERLRKNPDIAMRYQKIVKTV